LHEREVARESLDEWEVTRASLGGWKVATLELLLLVNAKGTLPSYVYPHNVQGRRAKRMYYLLPIDKKLDPTHSKTSLVL